MAQAHTDTMDTRKLRQPVVKERPARGREMQTQEDAAEAGPSTAARSDKVFHEGYVGGKKYLVPDSNLDAMADMINFKMRRVETSKYMSDSEALKNEDVEDNYLKKRESLFKKLDSLAEYGDEDGEEEEEEEEAAAEEEEEETAAEDKLEELPTSSSEEESEADKETEAEEEAETEEEEDENKLGKHDADEKSAVEEDEQSEEEESTEEEEDKGKKELGKDDTDLDKDMRSTEEEEEEPDDDEGDDTAGMSGPLKGLEQGKEDKEPKAEEPKEKKRVDDTDGLVPVYYHDPNVKRFLISGHFRSNRKPIYIVQQYEGQSVFKHKDPEFFSHKSEKDVDILIAGEFFKESILEEDRYKQPTFLRTKPRKVIVDWRSRVYETKFTDVFVGAEVDVELSGSFIQHSPAALHTPLLSIVLRKGTAQAASTSARAGPAVYAMRPIVENLFEKESAWENKRRKRSQARGKSGDYKVHEGRKRTGFQYPEGAHVSGLMTVYVSHPETYRDRTTGHERYSPPAVAGKRDTMRDTLVLPETSRRSGPRGGRERGPPGADLSSTSARREHIRRTLSRADNSGEILEAFVRSERDKMREKRKKERERVTMGSILSQLFLSK